MRNMPSVNLGVLVVWEKVMNSDWSAPGPGVTGRISDRRAVQFWDPDRKVSHALGEAKSGKPVWDWVGVYAPGTQWAGGSAKPVFSGRTVVGVAGKLADAISLRHESP